MIGVPNHTFLYSRRNLRIFGNFDLKYFCELRPGMFLWAIFNYGHLAKQYRDFGFVSPSMVLVTIFQSIYIADSVFNESAILTTMDIISDGFGFMLSFGDLVWVPFTFSLQSKFLAANPNHLSTAYLVFVSALFFLAYFIFRDSNNQKNRFRSDPNHPSVSGFKFIKTESGSKLLVDGWWKLSRHPNYLGDWLMGLSWCLLTGIPPYSSNVFAYFYCLYFAVLLVHRALRDDHKCRNKYGKDWEKYCSLVRSRIIPGIY